MHAVIVANAPGFELAPYHALVEAADLCIAADGGALPLLQAGMFPHEVIGDLDSLDATSEAVLVDRGVDMRRYPREKNETDFELALLLAAEQGATRIDVVGALGGRWDHTLANIWLLAHDALRGRQVRLLADTQTLFLVRDSATIKGKLGDTVSLIPLTPHVVGVTTSGLQYPLADATLEAQQARGVSNVLLDATAEISISSGLLVVVHHNDSGAHQLNAQRPDRSMADYDK